MNNLAHDVNEIQNHIKEYQDFPKKGILFRDIMPVFKNARLLQKMIHVLTHRVQQMHHSDIFVGIESRGFLLAAPMALHLGKSFIPARKKGKLPGKIASLTYELEYGYDTIEIQYESIVPNINYIIVDDLLATGGTALATASLIEKHGGKVVGFLFLIELSELNGRKQLEQKMTNTPIEVIVKY